MMGRYGRIRYTAILLQVFFLTYVISDSVTLQERCNDCVNGGCASQEFELGNCTALCSNCGGETCIGTGNFYIITENSNDNYTVQIFSEAGCAGTTLISSELAVCDGCQVYETSTCANYFVDCSSSWWIWLLVVVAVFIAIASIVVLIFLVRRRNNALKVVIEEAPQEVTSHHATYQSQPKYN